MVEVFLTAMAGLGICILTQFGTTYVKFQHRLGRRCSISSMRQTVRVSLILAILASLLSACFGRKDSALPQITITEPRSGAISSTADLRIRGFASDDSGIAQIIVDGSDLLASPVYESERGKRLIEFAFSKPDLQDGELVVALAVVDTSGKRIDYDYRIILDATPPTLELTNVTNTSSTQVRVEGIAYDNIGLSSIRVNGVALAFPAGAPEFQFSVLVERVSDGEVVVEDGAGNRTIRSL